MIATPATNNAHRYRIRNAKARPNSAEAGDDSSDGVIRGLTLYTASSFARLLGLGRWGLRNLRAAGLPARKIAGKTFILGSEAIEFFAALPAAPAPKRITRRETGEI